MNRLQRGRGLEEDVFYVLRAFSGRKFHQQQLVAASEPSVRSSGKKKCLVQLDADNSKPNNDTEPKQRSNNR